MDIVIGRGNNRQVVELPCAPLIKKLTKFEQREGRIGLCRLLGINEMMPKVGTTGKKGK